MKILHVIDSLGAGGAEWQVVNTCNFLQEHEHVVCYFQSNISLLSHFNKAQCIHIKKRFLIQRILGLRKHIKSIKPDIIHSQLIYSTFITRFCIKKTNRFFFTVQNVLSKDAFEKNKIWFLIERLTYKKNQNLIAVSPTVLRDYDNTIGIKGKSYVLYNTISANFFNVIKSYDKTIGYFKLVAVGNLREVKNHINLVKALGLLKEIKVSLTIYGSGNLEKTLIAEAQKLKVELILKGSVNELYKQLQQFDAFIMPSYFEGCSLAALEAMATGLPVILSEIDSFRDIAEHRAFYFNPHSADEIKKSILECYQNWELAVEWAKENKKITTERVSEITFKSRINQIYNI